MKGYALSISERSIVADSGLSLVSVSAGYGETVALENVDLEVLAGEAVSVIGRNGVGKSTLLMTIMGHTDLHSGSVYINGKEITAAKPYQRVWNGLGLVPQERDIFPSLTVDENLAVAVRAGPWTSERVYSMFPQLDARRKNLGDQLSGGEQQRVSIARALVTQPELIFADEPTGELDAITAESIVETLAEVAASRRATVIVATHDLDLADTAQRRLDLVDGRVVSDV